MNLSYVAEYEPGSTSKSVYRVWTVDAGIEIIRGFCEGSPRLASGRSQLDRYSAARAVRQHLRRDLHSPNIKGPFHDRHDHKLSLVSGIADESD
jgi:hypothetical protein